MFIPDTVFFAYLFVSSTRKKLRFWTVSFTSKSQPLEQGLAHSRDFLGEVFWTLKEKSGVEIELGETPVNRWFRNCRSR